MPRAIGRIVLYQLSPSFRKINIGFTIQIFISILSFQDIRLLIPPYLVIAYYYASSLRLPLRTQTVVSHATISWRGVFLRCLLSSLGFSVAYNHIDIMRHQPNPCLSLSRFTLSSLLRFLLSAQYPMLYSLLLVEPRRSARPSSPRC